MSFSRLRASRTFVNRALRVAVRNGGGGHHGPSVPPFARNAPPAGKLPEDFELIWDDGVAPETTIDFDAENLDIKQAVLFWLSGFLFFFSVYRFIAWTDPEGRNPVVPKQEVMNYDDYHYFLGLGKPEEYVKEESDHGHH